MHQSCLLCLPGPKVMRGERWIPTAAAAASGVASPWSPPHPPTPAKMPAQSPELLSNPSLSPLIPLDRVSAEHLDTRKHKRRRGVPSHQCNCRGEQLMSRCSRRCSHQHACVYQEHCLTPIKLDVLQIQNLWDVLVHFRLLNGFFWHLFS